MADLRSNTLLFAGHIDALVIGIESHMSRWTGLMHLLQLAMMALVVVSPTIPLCCGYLFVLEPVNQLKRAIQRVQGGDFDARVDKASSDEFGDFFGGLSGDKSTDGSLNRRQRL